MTASRRRGALAVCLTLFAWSLVPLALLALQALRSGGVLSGADGMLAGSDQQYYMASIRDAGSDVLISNEYRLGDSRGVLLHPMWLVSGALWALGVDLRVAFWLWKPVAALALGAGAWLYTGRFLEGRGRVAAVVLGLGFLSPVLPLLLWSGVNLPEVEHLIFLFASAEGHAALQLWGYLHAALSIGLMALFLLGVERVLVAERRRPGRGARWYLGWSSAAGLLAALMHPWKGAILLAILTGLALWGRLAPRYRVLVVPAAALVAPMVYLFLLPKLDRDWELSAQQNATIHGPLWILAAALLPLVVPALAGVRNVPRDDAGRMLLLWPPAALAVYALTTQFPWHALQGVAIPLAILAVLGFRRTALPVWAAAACIAALTLPGAAFLVDTFRDSKRADVAPYVLHADEQAALRFLERAPGEGGVLARYYLGMTVPPQTGRDTWVGQYPWTPDQPARAAAAEELFSGRLAPAAAQEMVRRIRPRWLLSDCRRRVDLGPLLGSLVSRRHRFGCADVYELAFRGRR